MSSDAGDKADALEQCSLPAKRRRGGRRASNPEISAEERKRLRVLKNRESAMKSLAKKAEFSASLEKLKTEAEEEHGATREKLQQLLTHALELRTQMDKVPGDHAPLLSGVDSHLERCANLLNDGDSGDENGVAAPPTAGPVSADEP